MQGDECDSSGSATCEEAVKPIEMPPQSQSSPFLFLADLIRSQSEPSWDAETTWIQGMELMHHFTAITWRTLPQADEMAEIWQLELPQLALSHNFLMHQLLTVAAAHKACLLRRSFPVAAVSYSLRSAEHQDKAIHYLAALPAIDDTNCPAIFLTASLLSIAAFPALAEHVQEKGRPGITELVRVFRLVRGIHDVLAQHQAVLEANPVVGRMLELGECDAETPLLEELTDELTVMLRVLSIGEGGADDDREVCLREAVEDLIYWIRHASGSVREPELRVALTWPARLTEGFLDLVARRDTDALKVVRCYSQILEALGPACWYLEGWGHNVTVDINSITSP